MSDPKERQGDANGLRLGIKERFTKSANGGKHTRIRERKRGWVLDEGPHLDRPVTPKPDRLRSFLPDDDLLLSRDDLFLSRDNPILSSDDPFIPGNDCFLPSYDLVKDIYHSPIRRSGNDGSWSSSRGGDSASGRHESAAQAAAERASLVDSVVGNGTSEHWGDSDQETDDGESTGKNELHFVSEIVWK